MRPTAYGSIKLWGFFVPIREQNKLSNYQSMGKLCPIKSVRNYTMDKRSNDEIYRKLMESRKKDPKHYGLTSIAVAYEDVRNYANSKQCDRKELKYLVERFTMRMREIAHRYGLSSAEVREYFAFHNYSLSF